MFFENNREDKQVFPSATKDFHSETHPCDTLPNVGKATDNNENNVDNTIFSLNG